MEIKYIDSPRKTSFIGEGREIDDANKILEQWNASNQKNITLSDIIRLCINRFNEEEGFRFSLLNEFRRKGEVINEEETAGKVFG